MFGPILIDNKPEKTVVLLFVPLGIGILETVIIKCCCCPRFDVQDTICND